MTHKVLIHELAGHGTVAYDADLLAGSAGYADAESFIDAAHRNESVLSNVVSSIDVYLDREPGNGAKAAAALRNRMEEAGATVLDSPADTRRAANDQRFATGLRATQAAITMQAARMPSMRSKMTAAALALATTAALSLVGTQHARADDFDNGNPQPTTQQQQANPARGLKDAVGGLFGAIVGNKLGHGSTFGTLAGGVVGVVATDKFQERNDPRAPAKPGERGYLPCGPQPMDPDKHARLSAQEQGFLRSRDAYAAALLNNEKVLEDVMLAPHDPATHARGVAAQNALNGAQAQYMQQRADFVKAAEFFGEHGYNVSEFAYSHKIAFNDLTARDVLRKDLAAANAIPSRTASGQSLQASP